MLENEFVNAARDHWDEMDPRIKSENIRQTIILMAKALDAGRLDKVSSFQPYDDTLAGVGLKMAELDSLFGINYGSIEMEEVLRISNEALRKGSYDEVLGHVFHEVWHKRDAKMADDLMSVVTNRKFTKAEREHAMLVALNYMNYISNKKDPEKYQIQYVEHSSYYFANHFKKIFKKKTEGH